MVNGHQLASGAQNAVEEFCAPDAVDAQNPQGSFAHLRENAGIYIKTLGGGILRTYAQISICESAFLFQQLPFNHG
jgi:hypothetical protein